MREREVIRSPHRAAGAGSPSGSRPGDCHRAEQEAEVHAVDRVPEQVREQRLDAVRPEAGQEGSHPARQTEDTNEGRAEEAPDQEWHPQSGADDPEYAAPDDPLDEVHGRGHGSERFEQDSEHGADDEAEDDGPDDSVDHVDDGPDDPHFAREGEGRIAEGEPPVQGVEVELRQLDPGKPQARNGCDHRRDESGDHRIRGRGLADQKPNARTFLSVHSSPRHGTAGYVIKPSAHGQLAVWTWRSGTISLPASSLLSPS